jgi:hypothetical protein
MTNLTQNVYLSNTPPPPPQIITTICSIFSIASIKTFVTILEHNNMTIYTRVQQDSHELNCILLLDYKHIFYGHNITNTRFVGPEVWAAEQ